MSAEVILDASVLIKCILDEEGTEAAVALTSSGVTVAAPDFIFVELASVLAKSVRRGLIDQPRGAMGLRQVHDIVDLFLPTEPLTGRAFDLAARHGFSAHDGLYLAAAEQRKTRVVTSDVRLVRRAEEAGLQGLVQSLLS